jgi:hypothetical protein
MIQPEARIVVDGMAGRTLSVSKAQILLEISLQLDSLKFFFQH